MQSLLSDNWHNVRWLKPRLRDGVRVHHRVFRSRASVLLFDPASHRFHRLSAEAWQVVELFDGQRSLDDIWELTALAGSVAPSVDVLDSGMDELQPSTKDAIGQHELVRLVSQLYSGDLLQSQVTPDAAEVLERYERQRKAKLKQIFMNPLSLKLPLFYPESWLKAHIPLAQRIFSAPIFWCWLVLVLPATVLVCMNWMQLTENLSDRILSAQNLFIAWFTYPVVKAIHEWSHALAIKKWGGQVREAGLIFLVFTPVPYVDATDTYRFASKWQRATVAAAGVMAELMLGAIAVYIWVLAEPGLLRTVAYNVFLIAGVSTLIVNGNPLMRYDGYFVLSEWLEVPNLAQRATKYWAYLADKYLYRSHNAHSPAVAKGEARIFFFYGAIAPVYRLSIALGLAWFVAEQYFIFGAIIAIAGLWSCLIVPIGRGWKHLRTSPSLTSRHGHALMLSGGLLGLIITILVFLPLPFYAVSEGVMWVSEQAEVRSGVDGLMSVSMVSPGQYLKKGDVIGVLDNPKLQTELETTNGQVDELDLLLRQEQIGDIAKAEATRHQLNAAIKKQREAEYKVGALVLVAGDSGRWTFVNGNEPVGQYFKRGQTIGYVVNGTTNIIRVAVTQEDVELVRSRTQAVSVRLLRRPFVSYNAHSIRPMTAGQQQLVSPALGSEGGGKIAVDPTQKEPTTALQRVFDYEIELDHQDPVAVFGDRAQVRFDLGWTPLAHQFFLRLRQAFLARLNM